MHCSSFLLLLFFLFISAVHTKAQPLEIPGKKDSLYIIIDHIRIEGNRRTKNTIITRELDINPNDTIVASKFNAILERNQNKLLNTKLFNVVEFHSTPVGEDSASHYQHHEIILAVQERWYTFPNIIFELADRNFNEWWTERGRDIRRTDYGIRFVQHNFRGRNEDLKLVLQGGFTKKAELAYNIPYINKKQQSGLRIAFYYATNKNVAYATQNNKLSFIADEAEVLRTRLNAGITYTRRVAYYNFSSYELKYHYNTINPLLATINPEYFLDGRIKQRYLSLRYTFTHDKRDIRSYPLSGELLSVSIDQTGFLPTDDVFITSIQGMVSYYAPLGKRFYLASEARASASYSPRQKQPYYNFRALGYGQQLVRGYEYYVVDGQHFALSRNSLRKQLFNSVFNLNKILPVKQFQTMPVAMYAKVYLDAGYVHNSLTAHLNPRFANRLMTGGGLGLDLVTYYDSVIRLEYSVNKAMETGFFLHFTKDI